MTKRLIALFLCVVLIFSVVPYIFAQSTGDTGLNIYADGNYASEVTLPENETLTVEALLNESAAGAFRWQIQIEDDLWADIAGATDAALQLRYAMLASLLKDNAATVRCCFTPVEGKELHSNEVRVEITQPVSVQQTSETAEPVVIYPEGFYENRPTAEETQAAPVNAVAEKTELVEDEDLAADEEAPYSTALMQVMAVDEIADDGEGEETTVPTTIYNIIINYVFADGTPAAESWTGTIGEGMSLSQTVPSPTVVGYAADPENIEIDISSAEQDYTYTVTYSAAIVAFTVEHYQQNTTDDNYTLLETVAKEGFTASAVGEGHQKSYEGFYALPYNAEEAIAADGSTVVKIYYDRYYYLLSFHLNGGYGTEPVYARYGSDITVNTPTRAGYIFVRWDKEIPATMPATSTAFEAQWIPGNTTFSVAFWYENADDEEYSLAGSLNSVSARAGDTVRSEDYKDTSFDGRDSEHFTYNAEKAETKTVAGDGSTVLNVYFTRNTYTITFTIKTDTPSCGMEPHEHTHSDTRFDIWTLTRQYIGGCYDEYEWSTANETICGITAHSHKNSCYYLRVTRKYDADITDIWTTDPVKEYLENGYLFLSSETDAYYTFLEKMDGQDITMTAISYPLGDSNKYSWDYLLEVPKEMQAPEGAVTKTDSDGRTYYVYHTSTLFGDSVKLTYEEDYFPITGFKQKYTKDVFNNNNNLNSFKYDRTQKMYVNTLYYIRNQHKLTFMNNGDVLEDKTRTRYFEQDFDKYFEPPYPSTLEPGAYVFEGWYDNPFFSEAGKIDDFAAEKMPDNSVILYAHWVPKEHRVNIYTNPEMTEQIGETQIVKHNEFAEEPEKPDNGVYDFVGWFYMTNDTIPVEKAFDFSMPVTRDMNLYAKWSSKVLVDYTVRYQFEGKDIADPTTGNILAGTTKTFDAKIGDDLYDGYRRGYFPKTNSHNLSMSIEEENEYIFEYEKKEELTYTVRYLYADEGDLYGTDVFEAREITTSDSIVTERFQSKKHYTPDKFRKTLVLSTEGENEIIFWYSYDPLRAPVLVTHWVQNITGEDYTEYLTADEIAIIDETYTVSPLSIDGFSYNAEKSTEEGFVGVDGLVLNLYYDRIEYPYEFRFVDKETGEELAPPVTGDARFEAQVTQNAQTIPGYTVNGSSVAAIRIAIEDPADTAAKNVYTFRYTEEKVDILYESIGEGGNLDSYKDNIKVFNDTPLGSQATADNGYRLIGWYKDAACTDPVDASWVTDGKIIPQKTVTLGDKQAYEKATYYAKFEPATGNLVITKKGADPIDADQSFIFEITGPDNYKQTLVIKGNGTATVKDLQVGDYTVTELSSWSWRYKAEAKIVSLQPGVTNAITIDNSRIISRWLSSDAYSENIFDGESK